MERKTEIFLIICHFKDFTYFYMVMNTERKDSKKDVFIKWIKRIGFWGFLFFLVKGLIWLALGYWVFK
ncbi:hypothetical protein [Pedobacter hartonius]|uniref:Alanyl-tRNA synthetase n=1 Tax=Pedobacter hartonius TaxID=425514 RepID=A0A1H4AWZ4_9SPHI|nr:hypothetical protein [Pedobacter hartonius]SEA40366.1 hypothetical protein SAMN05443550_103122 [Pedobacter hartonius]